MLLKENFQRESAPLHMLEVTWVSSRCCLKVTTPVYGGDYVSHNLIAIAGQPPLATLIRTTAAGRLLLSALSFRKNSHREGFPTVVHADVRHIDFSIRGCQIGSKHGTVWKNSANHAYAYYVYQANFKPESVHWGSGASDKF